MDLLRLMLVMRRRLIWAALFFLVGASGFSASVSLDLSAAFDEANKLYEQARYGAAADAYETLLRAGQQGAPSLWFNLGNARFKNRELGRSIAAYLHAQRLAPRDKGIAANLQLARRSVAGAEDATVPLTDRWLRLLRPNEWALLSVVLGWVFFGSLSLREFRSDWRSKLQSLGWASGAAWVVSLICSVSLLMASEKTIAVVVVADAAVRFTPLEESPVAFNAKEGMELVVLTRKESASGKNQSTWVEVRDAGSRSGWVRQDQLALIGDSEPFFSR